MLKTIFGCSLVCIIVTALIVGFFVYHITMNHIAKPVVMTPPCDKCPFSSEVINDYIVTGKKFGTNLRGYIFQMTQPGTLVHPVSGMPLFIQPLKEGENAMTRGDWLSIPGNAEKDKLGQSLVETDAEIARLQSYNVDMNLLVTKPSDNLISSVQSFVNMKPKKYVRM